MGRTYKDYNKELFQDHINNGQWEDLFETNSTSEKCNIFKEKFLDICNINAPIKKLKVTQNNPKWISRELYELMDQRDNAYKKAKATNSDQDFKSAKEVRNHLNRTIVKAKREYLEQTLTKNTLNHRKIWKKLQEHLPGKSKNNTISKMRNHSGDITDSPKDMANLLNDHFASIGLKLANDIPKRDNTNLLPHLLGNKLQDIRHTNAREVNEIIKRFILETSQTPPCVFIDLKKAFDTICHKKLVSKLKRMNITDKALEFFTNYLHNRQQQTVVNDCKSELRQMTVGVPQGY